MSEPKESYLLQKGTIESILRLLRILHEDSSESKLVADAQQWGRSFDPENELRSCVALNAFVLCQLIRVQLDGQAALIDDRGYVLPKD